MIRINEDNIYRTLIELFGNNKQLDKVVEELLELALAITHYRDNKIALPALITEITDVNIVLPQLILILANTTEQNIEKLIAYEKNNKIERILQVIKKAKEKKKRKRL